MTPASIPNLGQLSDLLLENGAGLLVDVSPVLILIGGIYLVYKKYVEWRVPLVFAVTVFFFNQTIAFFSAVFSLVQEGVLNPLMYLATIFTFLQVTDELSYVMIGVVFFGILFLATDSPTSPVTKNGRLVYGFACGLLVSIYGYFGNYVDGTLYGIFLANAIAAYLETKTLPSMYGHESLLERSYRRVVKRIPSSLKFEVVTDE